jgi:hypothetical protein
MPLTTAPVSGGRREQQWAEVFNAFTRADGTERYAVTGLGFAHRPAHHRNATAAR